MVRCKSTSRLPSVVLTQTDTTVGFISQDASRLAEIKSRPHHKPFIKIINSLENLRVPKKYKKIIRRSKKTTFIVNNQAFRISKKIISSQILRDTLWHYSTSANESNKNFDREFCEQKTDIIIEDKNGLKELSASSLIKLNKVKRRKIR